MPANCYGTIVVEEKRFISKPSESANLAEKIRPKIDINVEEMPKKRLGKLESPLTFMAVNNYSHNLLKELCPNIFLKNIELNR